MEFRRKSIDSEGPRGAGALFRREARGLGSTPERPDCIDIHRKSYDSEGPGGAEALCCVVL